VNANDLIARVKSLTPVSTAALNLVGLLDQPTIDNDDIIRVLKFDNVLTAKLLRACNSPFFGFVEPIASVDQAVLILGHQQILHIVLSIAFSSSLGPPQKSYAVPAKELWRHSLITALASENIAKSQDGAGNTSVAFTAGLLHDIGKLVMYHVLTPDYLSAIQARVVQGGLSRLDAEKEVIGVDHAAIGECLLQAWRLPEDIIEAVAHHHNPVSKPQPRLSSVIHAANCVAHLIGSDLGWEAFTVNADAGVVAALGIDREKLDELMIAAHDSMSQVESLMRVGV
jgi:putative nucleotidyltransferase with HDIG domain